MTSENDIRVGTKLKFRGERHRYTVQACNPYFAICTKPFSARRTVLYTIINWVERIRGTEDLIFGMGFGDREHCEQALNRLMAQESSVSHRNRVKLEIERIEP